MLIALTNICTTPFIELKKKHYFACEKSKKNRISKREVSKTKERLGVFMDRTKLEV